MESNCNAGSTTSNTSLAEDNTSIVDVEMKLVGQSKRKFKRRSNFSKEDRKKFKKMKTIEREQNDWKLLQPKSAVEILENFKDGFSVCYFEEPESVVTAELTVDDKIFTGYGKTSEDALKDGCERIMEKLLRQFVNGGPVPLGKDCANWDFFKPFAMHKLLTLWGIDPTLVGKHDMDSIRALEDLRDKFANGEDEGLDMLELRGTVPKFIYPEGLTEKTALIRFNNAFPYATIEVDMDVNADLKHKFVAKVKLDGREYTEAGSSKKSVKARLAYYILLQKILEKHD